MWFAVTNYPCNSLRPEVQLLHASGLLSIPPYLAKFQVHFDACDCTGLHFLLHCRSNQLLDAFKFVHQNRPTAVQLTNHIYDDLTRPQPIVSKQRQTLSDTPLNLNQKLKSFQSSDSVECTQSPNIIATPTSTAVTTNGSLSSSSDSDLNVSANNSFANVFKHLQLNCTPETLLRDHKQPSAFIVNNANSRVLPAELCDIYSNLVNDSIACRPPDPIHRMMPNVPSNQCDLWPYSSNEPFGSSVFWNASNHDSPSALKSAHLYAQVAEPMYMPIASSNAVYQHLDFMPPPIKCPLNAIAFQSNDILLLQSAHFASEYAEPKDPRSFCQRLIDFFCCI